MIDDRARRLERRYRMLLKTYPAAYRERRGDEMLGTLLDAAPPGRSWPSLADATDLIVAGVRHHTGMDQIPGLHRGVRLAGAAALGLAAGSSAVFALISQFGAPPYPSQVESIVHRNGPMIPEAPPPLDAGPWLDIAIRYPVYQLAALCFGAWILAGAARLVLPHRVSRVLTGLAFLLTPGLGIAATVWPALGGPEWPVVLLLTALGLVAYAGTGHPPSTAERVATLVIAAGTVGVVGLTHVVDPAYPHAGARAVGDGVLVAWLAMLLVLTVIGARRVAADPGWLWAAAIFAAVSGWLPVLLLATKWDLRYPSLTVLAALAALAGLAWIAVRASRGEDLDCAVDTGMTVTAVLAIGSVAGASAALLVLELLPESGGVPPVRGYPTPGLLACVAWLVAATGWIATRRTWIHRSLVVAAMVVTMLAWYIGDIAGLSAPDVATAVVMLGLGAVSLSAHRAPMNLTRRVVPGAALAVALVALGAVWWHHAWWDASARDGLLIFWDFGRPSGAGAVAHVGFVTWQQAPPLYADQPTPAILGLAPLGFALGVAAYRVATAVAGRVRRAPDTAAVR